MYNKVYCKDCKYKYYKIKDNGSFIDVCRHILNISKKDTPYQEITIYPDINILNRDNNCVNFEIKKVVVPTIVIPGYFDKESILEKIFKFLKKYW